MAKELKGSQVSLLPDPIELVLKELNSDSENVLELRNHIQSLTKANNLLQSEVNESRLAIQKYQKNSIERQEGDATIINQLQNSETRLVKQLESMRSKYNKLESEYIKYKSNFTFKFPFNHYSNLKFYRS